VPGGTTTALGLLLALGLDAEQRVSSSMPDNAHALKLAAVQTGLEALGRSKGDFVADPLGGAAALGDPMQPVVAGIALAASRFCPVLLGGGTQMATVHALLGALWRRPPPKFEEKIGLAQFSNIGLATTRWVSADPTADLAGLGAEITVRFKLPEVGYYAANLNFTQARYIPMQLYEQGYVKEGVGAGAAALATMLATGLSAAEMLPYIEQVYEELCLGQAPQ
jgi:NaMN:DMB phosphoribosyltransferase